MRDNLDRFRRKNAVAVVDLHELGLAQQRFTAPCL